MTLELDQNTPSFTVSICYLGSFRSLFIFVLSTDTCSLHTDKWTCSQQQPGNFTNHCCWCVKLSYSHFCHPEFCSESGLFDNAPPPPPNFLPISAWQQVTYGNPFLVKKDFLRFISFTSQEPDDCRNRVHSNPFDIYFHRLCTESANARSCRRPSLER